jgi:micrococcal nuclease
MTGRAALACLLAISLAIAGCTVSVGLDAGGAGAGEPAVDSRVTVVEVVDGDTVDVRFPDGSEDTVRLLGVDTPETYVENDPAEYEGVPDTEAGRACLERAGENATRFVERAVADGTVRVRTDPAADRRGSYDRLLAYVIVDNESINRALLDAGHARLYDSTFTERDDYAAAEREAMAAGRGLWACR